MPIILCGFTEASSRMARCLLACFSPIVLFCLGRKPAGPNSVPKSPQPRISPVRRRISRRASPVRHRLSHPRLSHSRARRKRTRRAAAAALPVAGRVGAPSWRSTGHHPRRPGLLLGHFKFHIKMVSYHHPQSFQVFSIFLASKFGLLQFAKPHLSRI